MRFTYIILFFICFATVACIQLPAYPQIIKIEKCKKTPSSRLFNQSQFASSPGKCEIKIIRDVGNIGREGLVAITIDSIKFAEMEIWETSSAFLAPGQHVFRVEWPSGVFTIGKTPKDTITVNIPDQQPLIVRIDLGNSPVPIRIVNQ